MSKLIHLQEGMRLGERYKLTEPLGRGSMAEVWAARDRASGDRVAIKVISELMARSSQAVKRFKREMLAIGSINHANVVALIDHGVVGDGRPFLVMELVEGDSLQAYLEQSQMIGVFSALMLASQVLEGLEAAHAKGIIHRDIKPANILLAHLGSGRRRVKILDFGVAHVLEISSEQDARLTAAGSILGSPRYMALEVARGTGEIDERADIFGVGAVMYHTLTGRPPFDGRGLGDILSKIYAHDIPPAKELRPDLPPELGACLERALAHEPDDRYPNAKAMRVEVDRLTEQLKPRE